MKQMTTLRRQRGVTLVIGLIMLVLITLMVTTAFMLSSTNLKAVGNMQFRDEAIAAANVAIERLVSTDFPSAPATSVAVVDKEVDIDGDGNDDYTVNLSTPVCKRVVPLKSLPPGDGDAVKCTIGTSGAVLCYETMWEVEATASPIGADTGAVVTVKQGINKRVSVTNLGTCS